MVVRHCFLKVGWYCHPFDDRERKGYLRIIIHTQGPQPNLCVAVWCHYVKKSKKLIQNFSPLFKSSRPEVLCKENLQKNTCVEVSIFSKHLKNTFKNTFHRTPPLFAFIFSKRFHGVGKMLRIRLFFQSKCKSHRQKHPF